MLDIPKPGTAVSDVLRWCVETAVHAPSKHNAQPWWFEIRHDVVELHADGSRAMPVSDPTGRELVVGCGAALYTLRLALRCAGYDPVTVEWPRGHGQSVLASVTAGRRTAPSIAELAMLAAVAERHTDRGPLDAAAMGTDVPFLLQRAAEEQGVTLQLLTSPGLRRTLADAVAVADRVESADRGFQDELRRWLPGIPLAARGPGAAGSYRAAFVQRDFDLTGEVPRDGDDVDDPMVAVLWTDGDHERDWLRAGQALQAVLLQATVAGIAASFLNQPLEMPATRAALRQDLALPGFPQLVLRLGVGHGGVPTPRRSADEVVS